MTISEMYLDGKLQPATTKPATTRQASTAAADPTVKADQQLPLGRFYSEEAEVTYEVIQGSDGLAIRRRPGIETLLRRTAADEYALGGNTVRFIRNASGQVTEMSLRGSRVFDLRFKKVD
jgi:hypothetical protein